MMPWKADVESMGQAMAKPSEVSANETRNTTTATDKTMQQVEMHAGEGREDEKYQSLNRRERGAAQNLAQHDCRARHGGDHHREQKAFLTVLDERHHGED